MPSIAVERAYEAVYILDPDLSDEQVAAITDRYKGIVEGQGATVQKVDLWERRKLAYEVKGRTEGIYVIMQFTGTAVAEAELRRVFQISEDQIRYLIVKMEEGDDSSAAVSDADESATAAPVAAAPAAEAVSDEPAPTAEPEMEETDQNAPEIAGAASI